MKNFILPHISFKGFRLDIPYSSSKMRLALKKEKNNKGDGIPGVQRLSCSSERLDEKKGRSDGFGVDEMLSVSISGPDSDRSSSSSKRSSISVGSMSPPDNLRSISS